jgi:sugar lactone lactonase YvrE
MKSRAVNAAARAALGLVALLPVACGDSSRPVADAIRVARGPLALDIDGDPSGLWWDGSAQKLYVADDAHSRILEWSDERGLLTFEPLPAAPPEGAGLGQLVRAADGSLVVTRFGFGTRGGVTAVRAGGAVVDVPGLDVTRRRIGLARAADGLLYDTWFVQQDSGERREAVAELSLDGSELEVITGLIQPIGVLAVGEQLFVSDQELGQVWVAPRADPANHRVFASLELPDLLAAGPDGSLFSGSAAGNVFHIDAAGRVSTFQTGFRQVRGVAYDGGERRLFVAEHDPSEDGAARHTLHILPVD